VGLAGSPAFAKDDEELPPDDENTTDSVKPGEKPTDSGDDLSPPLQPAKSSQSAKPAQPAQLLKHARPATPPAAPDEPWPLSRWEAEALRNSPLLGEAAAETKVQQARVMEAAWARFPRVDWQSSIVPVPTLRGDVLNTISEITNFTGFSGSFQQHKFDVNVPIFGFGRLRAQTRAMRASQAAAEAGERLARADVVLEIGKSYESVKVSRALVALYADANARLARADKKLDEFLEAGSNDADELDKNRFATLAADFANQVADAHKMGELSKFALRNAAGIEQSTSVGVDAAPLVLRALAREPIEALVRDAPGKRADLQATSSGVEAKRALYDGARAAYWPELFASGTLGVARCNVCQDQQNPFALDFLNMDLWSASLGVRWNIDFGMKVARVRQAAAELGKADGAARLAREAARVEVVDAHGKWKQAVAGVEIAKKGKASAEVWFAAVEQRFLVGKARASDFTEVLGNWLRFSGDELRAIYAANVAALALERAAGKTLIQR